MEFHEISQKCSTDDNLQIEGHIVSSEFYLYVAGENRKVKKAR